VHAKAVHIQVFVKKWKLLAYHLEDLRVPQVENPWPRGTFAYLQGSN